MEPEDVSINPEVLNASVHLVKLDSVANKTSLSLNQHLVLGPTLLTLPQEH